jgi:hypothetical protein
MKREKSLTWYVAKSSLHLLHLFAQNLANSRSHNIKTSSKSERLTFCKYAAATQTLRWLFLGARIVLFVARI